TATVRRGADRDDVAYREPYAKEKARLLARINEERRQAGIGPVAYDLLAAKVGDEFCADQAATRATGHWDTAGRPPHLRWALAGGVDYEAENFASRSRYGYPLKEEIGALILGAHESFMNERPPANGHKETILDPLFTHVGIGAARIGGEFRMTEEFVRRVADWIELPAGPLPAGSRARVAMKLRAPFRAGVVEIAWEAPPRPMTRGEIARRASYSYPPATHTLRPLLGGGMTWEGGGRGDFATTPDGRIELSVPLDHGPGVYYVIAYVGQSVTQRRLSPATGVPVVAE
ncbi:MAG TPA: CAP domain-containing protein, partial [Thermoanaerobaculia bacterium]|nr:CAP domain-containing protein [Thermoanaerobaculia bacterium]